MKCEETVVTAEKYASVLNHLKNNRVEYLVLLMLAHAVGLTAKVTEQTSGMCL